MLFLAPDGLRTISGTAKIDDIELGTISHHIQTLIKNLDELIATNEIKTKEEAVKWVSGYMCHCEEPKATKQSDVD